MNKIYEMRNGQKSTDEILFRTQMEMNEEYKCYIKGRMDKITNETLVPNQTSHEE